MFGGKRAGDDPRGQNGFGRVVFNIMYFPKYQPDLFTNSSKRMRWEYPCWRMLTVSRMPVERSWARTLSVENFRASRSSLGLMQRTKCGCPTTILESRSIREYYQGKKCTRSEVTKIIMRIITTVAGPGFQGSLSACKQLMESLRLNKNPAKRNNNTSSDLYCSVLIAAYGFSLNIT